MSWFKKALLPTALGGLGLAVWPNMIQPALPSAPQGLYICLLALTLGLCILPLPTAGLWKVCRTKLTATKSLVCVTLVWACIGFIVWHSFGVTLTAWSKPTSQSVKIDRAAVKTPLPSGPEISKMPVGPQPSLEQLFQAQTMGRYGGTVLRREVGIAGGIKVPVLIAVSADSEANSKFASFMVLQPQTPISPFSDWQFKTWLAVAEQFKDFEWVIDSTTTGSGMVGLGPNSMLFSKQIYLYTYGTMNYKAVAEIAKAFEKNDIKVLDVRNSDWLWNRREMLKYAISY
jgi:hypothetical protein